MPFLTAFLIGSAIASTAVEVGGHIAAGKANKRAGDAAQAAAEDQAGISDYNAQVAEQQATDAVAQGTTEEDRFRTQVRGMIGSQRTGFASNNVDVSSGSAVDVQADAAKLGELDALQIRTNAARAAWGYKVQAEDYRKQADVTRKTGVAQNAAAGAAATSQYFAAGGSLLTGTTSLLQLKYGMGKKAA
jgi:hypothetical protein